MCLCHRKNHKTPTQREEAPHLPFVSLHGTLDQQPSSSWLTQHDYLHNQLQHPQSHIPAPASAVPHPLSNPCGSTPCSSSRGSAPCSTSRSACSRISTIPGYGSTLLPSGLSQPSTTLQTRHFHVPALPPIMEHLIASSYGLPKLLMPHFKSSRNSEFAFLKMTLVNMTSNHRHLNELYKHQVLLGHLKLPSALQLSKTYMHEPRPYTAAYKPCRISTVSPGNSSSMS